MKNLKTWFDKERGNKKKLSLHLGISSQALTKWKRVPAERVLDVEAFTGVSRHDLRPDVYGAKA